MPHTMHFLAAFRAFCLVGQVYLATIMLLFGAPCPTRSDAKEHGKRHDARFTGFVAKVKQRHRRQVACTSSAGADRRAFQLGLVQSCSLLGCPRSLYVPRAWVLVGPGQCGPGVDLFSA